MPKIATRGKEVVVEIKNDPGAGAEVMDALGAARINVTAMVAYTEGTKRKKKAWIHLFCTDPAGAKKLLTKAGYKSRQNNVLVLNVPNRPGKMADVLHRAAEKKVDFEYAYGSTTGRAGFAVFYTRTIAKAIRAINQE